MIVANNNPNLYLVVFDRRDDEECKIAAYQFARYPLVAWCVSCARADPVTPYGPVMPSQESAVIDVSTDAWFGLTGRLAGKAGVSEAHMETTYLRVTQ